MPAPATPPVSVPSDITGLEERVRDAQTAMLHQRVQVTTLAGIGFALMACIGLLPSNDVNVLWTWFALRCGIAILRIALSRNFLRMTATGTSGWRRSFIAMLLADGFVWGLAAVWVSPYADSFGTSMVIAFLMGVAAVELFALQASFVASTSFLVAMLMPVAIIGLLEGSRFGVFASIALLAFLVLVIVEAVRSEARIRELLTLRFYTDRISEERAEALRHAQRQSSVKSQFLATMSHEMRTPLHGILGLTRMLRNERPADPSEKLQLVERAGEHLLTLINDILDFSKLEAGRARLSPQLFDLAALIDDVVSLLVPSACQAGLTLTTRLHLPRPCHVHGDASRIRQVLHNLVGNAIKFTESGAVTVVAKHREGCTCVEVHDTGVGISPHDLTRIFDAFHQADSSFTRRFGGTGLGLTIARELARAMGGDLVCTSQEGRGSCFTVTMALPAVASPAPVTAPMQGDELPRLQGHVLLAEDNPVNALVAEAALKRMGFTVELVEDGLQALASFRARTPDVVLLDWQMPVMDGFEAVRRMREHERTQSLSRTPVVALTANAFEGDREHSLAAGMDDYLAKPFRDDQLHAVLQRLLACDGLSAIACDPARDRRRSHAASGTAP